MKLAVLALLVAVASGAPTFQPNGGSEANFNGEHASMNGLGGGAGGANCSPEQQAKYVSAVLDCKRTISKCKNVQTLIFLICSVRAANVGRSVEKRAGRRPTMRFDDVEKRQCDSQRRRDANGAHVDNNDDDDGGAGDRRAGDRGANERRIGTHEAANKRALRRVFCSTRHLR